MWVMMVMNMGIWAFRLIFEPIHLVSGSVVVEVAAAVVLGMEVMLPLLLLESMIPQ